MADRNRGFTLIEMMVVVAIIGVLAAMSIPNVMDRMSRQHVQEAYHFAEFARGSVQQFYAKHRRLPQNNTEAGLPPADRIIANTISQVEVVDGAIHLQFGNRANKTMHGRWLTLRPGRVEGAPQVPLSWQCGRALPVAKLQYAGDNRTDLRPEFLPVDCRG